MRNTIFVCMAATATLALGVPSAARAAVDCSAFTARRLALFEARAASFTRVCARRAARAGTTCPDGRLNAQLDALTRRIVRDVSRRCPDVDVGAALVAARADVACRALGDCAPARVTLAVTSGALARDAGPASRRLSVDAGWSGLTHDLAILEGAAFTAELSGCDGTADTLCDLHGATAGTAFGAPSPISAAGVAVCTTVDFASDLTGALDLASGDVSEEARVRIGVFLGESIDRPCPACVPADGDPEVGEDGTCAGGPNAGAACRVEGLGDPSLGAARGTSATCGAGTAEVATFTSAATATTGAFTFGPLPGSPSCRNGRFAGRACPCSTCNDAEATACRTDGDCPASGGAPGVCGGRRCLGGAHAGMPCSAGADCPGGFCGVPGEPTALNACLDEVCTPTSDGHGECLAGPIDQFCAVARFRGCISDDDCPAGDTCAQANRACHPDTVVLQGVPDVPSEGRAHPTLVGGFCMSSSNVAAVNAVGGFPGPVTYTWPAELTVTP